MYRPIDSDLTDLVPSATTTGITTILSLIHTIHGTTHGDLTDLMEVFTPMVLDLVMDTAVGVVLVTEVVQYSTPVITFT